MKAMYGVVLLCTEGMAICEDDWEDLWCAEMPEEFEAKESDHKLVKETVLKSTD